MSHCRRLFVIISTLLLVVGTMQPAVAVREGIVPATGTFRVVSTTLTALDAFVVDDANQRVFAASRGQNTVVAFDFEGNQTAINSTLAQPSSIAVGGGNVFALLRGTGQIVRLNPLTLVAGVVVGGLANASGLAYTNGALYVSKQVGESFQNEILRVDPSSGTISRPGIVAYGNDFVLNSFQLAPDVLFATRRDTSPGGVFRFDLVTTATTYLHESPEDYTMLPDGQIVTASGISDQPGGALARNSETLRLSGRRWLIDEAMPTAFDSSAYAMTIGRNNEIQLGSNVNTAEIYRRYRLAEGTTVLPRGLATSADSRRLFVAAAFNGMVRLYALPGVSIGGEAPQATGVGSGSRADAPQAPGGSAGSDPRTAAPQTFNPPWVMSSVSDIEFGSDGFVYASDSVGGVVNAFSEDGVPMTGWRQLDGAAELAEFNGSMFAVLKTEGSIARIDRARRDATRVARNIALASGLTAANGKLWSTYYVGLYTSPVVSVDPANGAITFEPNTYAQGFNWNNVNLAEVPIGGQLWGASSYGETLTFDLETKVFESLTGGFIAPFAVSPHGATVIDGLGRRATTSPFALDGFVFPGRNHTMSGVTNEGYGLVAAMLDNELVVYDETNPGNIIFRSAAPEGYQVQRLEFRPGTNELWIGWLSLNTGRAVVFPFVVETSPSQSAVIGSETMTNEADVLVRASLASSVASAERVSPKTETPPIAAIPTTAIPTAAIPSTAIPTTDVPSAAASPVSSPIGEAQLAPEVNTGSNESGRSADAPQPIEGAIPVTVAADAPSPVPPKSQATSQATRTSAHQKKLIRPVKRSPKRPVKRPVKQSTKRAAAQQRR
jgi:hypothetical protein